MARDAVGVRSLIVWDVEPCASRMQGNAMPFDGQRMIYGGFQPFMQL